LGWVLLLISTRLRQEIASKLSDGATRLYVEARKAVIGVTRAHKIKALRKTRIIHKQEDLLNSIDNDRIGG
jgi:hypothetical protein